MTRAKKYTVDLKMFKGNEPIPCLIATWDQMRTQSAYKVRLLHMCSRALLMIQIIYHQILPFKSLRTLEGHDMSWQTTCPIGYSQHASNVFKWEWLSPSSSSPRHRRKLGKGCIMLHPTPRPARRNGKQQATSVCPVLPKAESICMWCG
jgi:hypothetical protein